LYLTQILGDAVAMEVINDHDTIVRRAFSERDGREIKHTGDGIMTCFSSVAGSINCGKDIQKDVMENKHANPQINLRVKIGLSAGEPVEKNQYLFGTAVQLAARICHHANANEILISYTVQDLCICKGFKFGQLDEV